MKYLYHLPRVILIVTLIMASTINGEAQTGWNQSVGQSLINALKISEPLTFCNEPVPLSDPDVKERLERELLLSLHNSDDVILWLKRANRYFPHIEKVLKNNSLPDDLKYIVIAESALMPRAAPSSG